MSAPASLPGLKACPFCGEGETNTHFHQSSGLPSGRNDVVLQWSLQHRCRSPLSGIGPCTVVMHGVAEAEAIAAWNRRASFSNEWTKEIERLQKVNAELVEALEPDLVEAAASRLEKLGSEESAARLRDLADRQRAAISKAQSRESSDVEA